jgi:rRNA processing protein Gar1
MFITVNNIETNAPVIINTNHIIGIVADGLGNVYVKMTGESSAFMIQETIEQMEKLLSVANM